jgi:hypothetical protein
MWSTSNKLSITLGTHNPGRQFNSFLEIKAWSYKLFLDIYTTDLKTYVHTKTCMQQFIQALFKNWKLEEVNFISCLSLKLKVYSLPNKFYYHFH